MLLDELGAEAYAEELAEHRRLVREAFEREQGVEVDTQGDAFFVAFASARHAAAAAAAAQRALADGPIRVRMGLHTGEALLTEQGYVGMDVHRAARVAGVAHGGQVLLSRTTRDLLDESVAVTDLGDHRLKDLSAPERLYQLGEELFPPPRSLYRTNLPIPATPFLGREAELGEVGALLAREEVRLVTLTGPGGTGKTRLALQAAAGVERLIPGRCLVGAARPGPRPGARAGDGEHRRSARARIFRSTWAIARCCCCSTTSSTSPRRPTRWPSLLAACPNLNVLVTSREPLHLGGEHEYAVPTLRHDEAVALFVDAGAGCRPVVPADRRGRRDLSPPRRPAARGRARCRAREGAVAGPDPGAARSAAAASRGRATGRAGAAANAPRHDRVELRPAELRGAAAAGSPVRLFRRLHPRRL